LISAFGYSKYQMSVGGYSLFQPHIDYQAFVFLGIFM